MAKGKGAKRAPGGLKLKNARHMDTDDTGKRMTSQQMTGVMKRMPKGRKTR